MSTGAECNIWEVRDEGWYARVQRWPYGDSPDFDVGGPFTSEDSAIAWVFANFANPGGYSIYPLDNDWLGDEIRQQWKDDT